MTSRRAIEAGLIIVAATGILMAGYNGSALYVWYTTGNVEILGGLRDRAHAPFLYSKSLTQNFIGFGFGAFLLILVPFRAVTFWKALRRRNEP
jgi:hypothetical protein